jgi:predicted nucleic acid-binding protein
MTAFLDTNVLIYAQGAGTKSEVARQMILAGGVISVQVLNEFAAVLRRKFGFEWEVIAEAIADVRTALDPVRPIDVVAHTEAVSLPHAHGFSARAPSCG